MKTKTTKTAPKSKAPKAAKTAKVTPVVDEPTIPVGEEPTAEATAEASPADEPTAAAPATEEPTAEAIAPANEPTAAAPMAEESTTETDTPPTPVGAEPPDQADAPYAGFEVYDVVQISTDDGATWEDYETIRTIADGHAALEACQRKGPRKHRIVSGDKQTVKVTYAPPAKTPKKAKPAKPATEKPAKPAKNVAEPKAKKVSALDAAALVLAASAEPLTCADLIAKMKEQNLWESAKGLTPEATLNAAINKEIKVKGAESRFAKADRGKYTLSATPK